MKWNDMARGAMNYGESTTKFGKSLEKYHFFKITSMVENPKIY